MIAPRSELTHGAKLRLRHAMGKVVVDSAEDIVKQHGLVVDVLEAGILQQRVTGVILALGAKCAWRGGIDQEVVVLNDVSTHCCRVIVVRRLEVPNLKAIGNLIPLFEDFGLELNLQGQDGELLF